MSAVLIQRSRLPCHSFRVPFLRTLQRSELCELSATGFAHFLIAICSLTLVTSLHIFKFCAMPADLDTVSCCRNVFRSKEGGQQRQYEGPLPQLEDKHFASAGLKAYNPSAKWLSHVFQAHAQPWLTLSDRLMASCTGSVLCVDHTFKYAHLLYTSQYFLDLTLYQ